MLKIFEFGPFMDNRIGMEGDKINAIHGILCSRNSALSMTSLKKKGLNEVSKVSMQIYALYFIIVLYFWEQEDDKATNFCLSFSLIQIKFPNKYQKQRGQFHKRLNFYEIIPLLPSCGWSAALYCLFYISPPALWRNVFWYSRLPGNPLPESYKRKSF